MSAAREALNWLHGDFAVHDPSPDDDHSAIYLICPGGLMVNTSGDPTPGLDAKRTAWMAENLNAALALPSPRSREEADEAPKPDRDAMYNRTEEEWDAVFDAISTVNGLRAGHTLTDDDIAALHLVDRTHRDDEMTATEAYHRGLEDGLRERGGDELVRLEERVSKAIVERAVERAMRTLAQQRADQAEFLLALALAILALAERNLGGDDGWKLVPVSSTEEQDMAARGLIMMDRFGGPSEGYTLGQHAESGFYGEYWGHLLTEEERGYAHRLSKGELANLIYRAMVANAPPLGGGDEDQGETDVR